ncbi:MAG: polyprenyl synthetase family protein, partial [Myxococcota bacterium]|nr:polyprenyl synthetase family protein [Myxococcota bacterium]
MSDMKAKLTQLREEFDVALREGLAERAWPQRLSEACMYSLFSGGKRVRPCLALLAAEVAGGTRAAALPWAMAIELIHSYSLIHDDLPAMDDDDMRRGQPTCHRRFDEATAILAGDALLTEAF